MHTRVTSSQPSHGREAGSRKTPGPSNGALQPVSASPNYNVQCMRLLHYTLTCKPEKGIITLFPLCRVLKQALRTSGGNATDKHIKEVSLCSLFLMEAAKKADQEFGITPRSTRHTTRDASADIHKITDHLLENKVTAPQAGRTTPTFRDVTEDGFKKMSQAWLKQVLVRAPDVESVRSTDTEQEPMQGTIDLDYELYHSH